jgi:hypothetical protein
MTAQARFRFECQASTIRDPSAKDGFLIRIYQGSVPMARRHKEVFMSLYD